MDEKIFQQITELSRSLANVAATVDQLKKEINRMRIDGSNYIPKTKSITPGISTKVAYDTNGLVVQGMDLSPSDIPNLQISHIDGLKSALDNVMNSGDVKKIKNELREMIISRGAPVSTAIKVNYDANGLIVSGSQLTCDDIPEIPINKVSGLSDIIDVIDGLTNSNSRSSVVNEADKETFKSGTFTKVNVDSFGRVINGEKLSINDIPIDVIQRLINLENKEVDLAPMSTVTDLIKQVSAKIDKSVSTSAGKYIKVVVNADGLVIGGESLTIDDLPELTIDMISGLRAELNKAANQEQVIAINDGMSKILGSIQSISDINQVKNSLSLKAEADDVDRLRKEFDQFKDSMGRNEEILPSELILKRLDTIDASLSTLEGRVSVIENKLGLSEN